jgi:hypothetical protein
LEQNAQRKDEVTLIGNVVLGELEQIMATQELTGDIIELLNEIVGLLQKHESRLELLELPPEKLPPKLQRTMEKICEMKDPIKKAAALDEFNILCRAFRNPEEF